MGSSDGGGATQAERTDLERALLGSLILDAERFDEAADVIRPGDWSLVNHRIVWQAIEGVLKSETAVDFVTLAAYLDRGTIPAPDGKGWAPYLIELGDSTTSLSHFRSHLELFERATRLDKILALGRAIAEEGPKANPANVEEYEGWVQKLERATFAVTNPRSYRTMDPIAEALESAFAEIQNEGASRLIRTGFWKLDEIIDGLAPGRFYVFGARPGAGKSAILCQMALNLADPKTHMERERVLLASLEMSREEIGRRLLGNDSDVDTRKLRFGVMTDEEDAAVREAAARLNGLPMDLAYDPGMSPTSLRGMARQAARRGASVVFVDYLQLMTIPGWKRGDGRQAEVASISREMKKLAGELGVAVVVACQINREAGDDEPSLHHLRESGAIEQDADVVVMMWRERHEGVPHGPIKCKVSKNRHGPLGRFDLGFKVETQKVSDYGWEDSEAEVLR